MPEPVQAECAATGSCKVEEDEAIERCELAPVQDWKEALMRVRVEIGHRRHAGDDEGGWPSEQTYHDEHTANQLDDAGSTAHCHGRRIVHRSNGKVEVFGGAMLQKKQPGHDAQEAQELCGVRA